MSVIVVNGKVTKKKNKASAWQKYHEGKQKENPTKENLFHPPCIAKITKGNLTIELPLL